MVSLDQTQPHVFATTFVGLLLTTAHSVLGAGPKVFTGLLVCAGLIPVLAFLLATGLIYDLQRYLHKRRLRGHEWRTPLRR